uniref:HepT-like ribonuclease domain-containing protein n=1 Tax=Candidatus Electrothrix sp. TaxID=2170559 RepID=UPI004057A02C
MSSRIVSHFLADILAAINAIARFTEQMDFEQFRRDEKTIRAVERELEIIGEAVKKSNFDHTTFLGGIPVHFSST